MDVIPIISLTPVKKANFTLTLPLAQQILMNPNEIYYDPYRTFTLYYPNADVIYVNNPDPSDGLDVKREVYKDAWLKFRTLWIYEYPVILKYVRPGGGLVKTLKEGERAKPNKKDDNEKIAWLLLNFYTLSDVADAVEKYRRLSVEYDGYKMGIHEVLGDAHVDRFREFLLHQMKRKLLREIKN